VNLHINISAFKVESWLFARVIIYYLFEELIYAMAHYSYSNYCITISRYIIFFIDQTALHLSSHNLCNTNNIFVIRNLSLLYHNDFSNMIMVDDSLVP